MVPFYMGGGYQYNYSIYLSIAIIYFRRTYNYYHNIQKNNGGLIITNKYLIISLFKWIDSLMCLRCILENFVIEFGLLWKGLSIF